MYFPELTRECQIAAGDAIRAVGWLCAAHPFASGAVPPDFVEALRRLVRLGWCPVAVAGSHACEFCVGAQVRESANVLVPGSGVLYVAPAMVTHYVEAHGYQPPSEFIDAVLSCPEPGTCAYRDALAAFLDCWSGLVPREALVASLEEHRALRSVPTPTFATLDGEGAFDPPWYVAVVGGVEGSPVAIARALAACRGTTLAAALAALRAGAVLEFDDVQKATASARRLEAAGAKVRVWNAPRR